MSTVRLFIYGTLRQGCPYHHLLGPSEYLGSTRTSEGFALIDLGTYPAMVPAPQGRVFGELYSVNATTLKVLDEYEDHPGLYQRQPIALENGEQAIAYVMPRERVTEERRILSGDWLCR